jgi:DNA mismatch repair protein MutL
MTTTTIRVLAPEVVARIAAGEVVERPASVVKELVENSLDAGATVIGVECRGGGVALIQVSDNGAGIPAAEAAVAFERHATSKLASFADLDSIATLGFRGEALPSIAAVAEVEIVTLAADEADNVSADTPSAATYLSLRGGQVVSRGSRARSGGTTVAVRNLFRNVPARLKFLKSAATESSHIARVVSQYALAYPAVKFTLTADSREVLGTPGTGRLLDAALAVYGLEIAGNLIEIADSKWGSGAGPAAIGVSGLVGTPAIARASRDYLSFFVNRRWVNSRLLAAAAEEAFHGLLTVGRHPVVVLNIALPAGEVDVNIHPAKSEVKFANERAVFAAVQRAVRSVLTASAPVPRLEEPAPVFTAPAGVVRRPAPVPLESLLDTLPAAPATTPLFALPALRILGQLAASYIIAEGPDGLYLIDQHAAHERVLFEQVMTERSQQRVAVQGLLEPATFTVTPPQNEVMKSLANELAGFGFAIEPFGERTYLVRAIPASLGRNDWGAALRELLDSPPGGAGWPEKIAESVACHGAVRAGQALSDDEMRRLVRDLEQVGTPHTCPHGRPTMIHLSVQQLAREFGR